MLGSQPDRAQPPVLVVDEVGIEYRNSAKGPRFSAVGSVSFDLRQNELVSIVGPSGCGKSTLLAAIGGLVPYTSGGIRIAADQCAMVFQKAALLPWRTAVDNVAYPLRLQHVPRSQARKRATDQLRRVGLKDFTEYYPDQLSGGMQQRVNLARALVTDPDVLLLDEPFAAIDALMREVLQADLLALVEQSSLSGVLVTHQIEEAVLLGDRIVVMSRGPNSHVRAIVDVGLPHPRNDEMRKSMAFVEKVAEVWDIVRVEVGIA